MVFIKSKTDTAADRQRLNPSSTVHRRLMHKYLSQKATGTERSSTSRVGVTPGACDIRKLNFSGIDASMIHVRQSAQKGSVETTTSALEQQLESSSLRKS